MLDPRTERIHSNNDRFREANETIRRRAEALDVDMEELPFLCECATEECVEILRLTRDQYSAVRDHPDRYITAIGHEVVEQAVGEVVARLDGYVVVAKPR